MKQQMAALLLGGCSTLIQAQEMQPGLWEITTITRMQGKDLPGGKFTNCLTAKDIAAGQQFNPDDSGKCKISNMKNSGGSISYDMNCSIEGGKMVGSVTGKLSATSYTFDQKMHMSPDQGMGEMQSTLQGRRLGDCK